MIVSGTLAHTRGPHVAASAHFAERLAELEERRGQAESAIAALLESWKGDAAAHFDSKWQAWDGSAREVIDQLAALIAEIDLARADLEDADEHAIVLPRQLDRRLR